MCLPQKTSLEACYVLVFFFLLLTLPLRRKGHPSHARLGSQLVFVRLQWLTPLGWSCRLHHVKAVDKASAAVSSRLPGGMCRLSGRNAWWLRVSVREEQTFICMISTSYHTGCLLAGHCPLTPSHHLGRFRTAFRSTSTDFPGRCQVRPPGLHIFDHLPQRTALLPRGWH